MYKYKKIIIFFLCLCIAFFPIFIPLAIHADGGFTYDFISTYGLPSDIVYLNQADYESSDLYISGNTPRFGIISETKYQNFYSDLSNISVSTELPNFGIYPNFFIYCTDGRYFKIIFFDDNELNLLLCNNSMIGARLSNTNDLKSLVYDSNTRTFYVESNSYAPWDSYTPARYFSSSYTYQSYYCLSNYPILYTTSTRQNNDVGNQYYYDGSSGFNDVNYIDFDSTGSSGETSSNNLYMDGAKWSFDIPYYSLDQSGAVYGSGTATFSGSLNDFQISNTSDFTLEFLFTSFLSGYRYSWAQDSEKEDFSYKYIYSTEISLSDFYSNGQVASFNISDIFDNSISVNPTHLGTSITEDCLRISNSQAVNISNWNTTFTVALKSNDEFSGKCSSMYSYLLRKSKNTDNSIQTNNNPYTGEEGSNSVPDSDIFNGESAGALAGNSNSTSNIGDYSVVNNNNPHITINNNNDNGFTNAIENGDSDGLLSKLLLLLANNQSTTSSGISEIADTSGYVQVMGSVFTAVPAAWWTTLTVAFVACIGILVVSFVIKIILKFVI